MRNTAMQGPSRRSLLRASLGAAGSFTLACPFIANAAAKTATVWWVQGFVPEEDAAFEEMVARLRKAERQQDRIQHHSFRAAAAEDHLGDHQRRCSRPDKRDAARGGAVAGLGRPARRRHRRGRNAEIRDAADRGGVRVLLQPGREQSAASTPCLTQARWSRSTSGGHWSRRPDTRSRTSRTSGTLSSISSSRCKRSCRNRACGTPTPAPS